MAASRGYSLVGEHKLWSTCDSVVEVPGLRSCGSLGTGLVVVATGSM